VHQYASGVWIDACGVHGVWLDAGELEQLEAYAEASFRGMGAAPAASNVGVGTPRIASDVDVPVESARDISFEAAGSLADFAMDVPLSPFETLGSFVDGGRSIASGGSKILAWRKHERGHDARGQALVDAARESTAGADPVAPSAD
jgi:hypothetical protein